MKKALLFLVCMLFAVSVEARQLAGVSFALTDTTAATGVLVVGADEVTCAFSGFGTAVVDIEGSVDNSTWDDLINDRTTNGNASATNQPFRYIRAVADSLTDAITIKCVVFGD